MHSLFAWQAAKAASKSVNSFGASTLQGRRPKQEDRYFAADQLPGGPPGMRFYAVYDGHGGERAACFATETMHKCLIKSKAFQSRDHIKALEQAFLDVENQFLRIAEREGLSDGTTALVALIEDANLTVAHVGDSRGVLCRDGAAIAITEDHKPELEAERQRIESLGGFVSHIGCWRAMGILAMSRAIGDLFLKPYVTAQPEVRKVPLQDSDEFIVLASDGIFDVFDNEQVVRIVRAASSPQQAASLLTKSAFVAGSLDNLTAVVVALRGYQPRLQMAAASPAEGCVSGAEVACAAACGVAFSGTGSGLTSDSTGTSAGSSAQGQEAAQGFSRLRGGGPLLARDASGPLSRAWARAEGAACIAAGPAEGVEHRAVCGGARAASEPSVAHSLPGAAAAPPWWFDAWCEVLS
uniref:PPM-type phosphatase domain-containing protein n=1 Tax=Calcidiscus leptoporus TaxID=127549 RepID=A0A7S0J6S1_9EUKA|mmetsp:Transcript_41064/g.95901  ORF Transcript_41064/g.95901 Transcript_41064/m.95901 type:complete len:410 (+) Transcript_41064:128-1357(+)